MSTRLKRPAFWRHLALTAALLGFQGYLGYSALNGQFGIDSRDDLVAEIAIQRGQSAALQAEIDSYTHRISLFNTRKLDPDILDEGARSLLNMANAADVIVMVDTTTGKPIISSPYQLSEDQLSSIIVEPAAL